jgi:hypothetical protein
LRFFSLQEEEFVTDTSLQGGLQLIITTDQWTSQSVGKNPRRPSAPALSQTVTSTLIWSFTSWTEDRSPSKTQELQCFQISQGTSSVRVARPLHINLGVACLAASNQSMREGSQSGGSQVSLRGDRVTCQTCLQKGHDFLNIRLESPTLN